MAGRAEKEEKGGDRMNILRILIAMARLRDGDDVTPCVNKTWGQCIEIINGKTYLYYNAPSHTTHVVVYPAAA